MGTRSSIESTRKGIYSKTTGNISTCVSSSSTYSRIFGSPTKYPRQSEKTSLIRDYRYSFLPSLCPCPRTQYPPTNIPPSSLYIPPSSLCIPPSSLSPSPSSSNKSSLPTPLRTQNGDLGPRPHRPPSRLRPRSQTPLHLILRIRLGQTLQPQRTKMGPPTPCSPPQGFRIYSTTSSPGKSRSV